MNYKVLYRKYRPTGFDSLLGQNQVITILKNSIKDNKIAHAYLFSGPRGTGKTSTARILAKAVNCLNPKDGNACDECDACKNITSNPDIIEIDAASNNGVDEIRELISNVKIMPTSLKYKVYIIDEVHMLSQSAFNALLLTLEEPPSHVIFILATTNPESVPITIVSRCQRFDFKRINEQIIFDNLKKVCDLEKIKYTEEGLLEIAQLSDGGMRDALSILDQLSKEDTEINADLVAQEVGSVSNKLIVNLVNKINEKDISEIEEIFEELKSNNVNYKIIIKKLIGELSKTAAKILNCEVNFNLEFDEIKKMVMELNELANKININVDPYLLIKMVVFSYVSSTNNVISKEKTKEPEIKKVENKQEEKRTTVDVVKKSQNSSIDDLVRIRINNCFVEATKDALLNLKQQWKYFKEENKNPKIKGLISDTSVVAASNDYAIMVTGLPHQESELNENIKYIENKFKEFSSISIKLIFINETMWNKEKETYINNLKNNYKYEIIEEVKKDGNIAISEIADVFDVDKIEIE